MRNLSPRWAAQATLTVTLSNRRFSPIQLCDGAKIGTMLSNVSMGGRSAQWSGPPFILPQAYLKSISAGRMTFRGYSRPTMTDLGRTVCLVDPETGFHIVVVERNCQVFDDNWMINHGIVPDQFRLIGIKSAVHFRAWFGDKTSSIIVVDGQPGLTSHNIDAFPKVKHVESLFPYHEGVEYERGRGLDVKERTGGFGAKVRL